MGETTQAAALAAAVARYRYAAPRLCAVPQANPSRWVASVRSSGCYASLPHEPSLATMASLMEVVVAAVDTDVIEWHRRANLSSRGDVFE
jgi:hypothetical protein